MPLERFEEELYGIYVDYLFGVSRSEFSFEHERRIIAETIRLGLRLAELYTEAYYAVQQGKRSLLAHALNHDFGDPKKPLRYAPIVFYPAHLFFRSPRDRWGANIVFTKDKEYRGMGSAAKGPGGGIKVFWVPYSAPFWAELYTYPEGTPEAVWVDNVKVMAHEIHHVYGGSVEFIPSVFEIVLWWAVHDRFDWKLVPDKWMRWWRWSVEQDFYWYGKKKRGKNIDDVLYMLSELGVRSYPSEAIAKLRALKQRKGQT